MLRSHDAGVYRAHIPLGTLRRESCERLHVPSDQNNAAISPTDLSLVFYPVVINALESEELVHVSYLALSISGRGYCWPRTIRQVIDAVRSDADVAPMAELMRRHWPSPRQ